MYGLLFRSLAISRNAYKFQKKRMRQLTRLVLLGSRKFLVLLVLSLNSKRKIFYILGDININTLCDSRQPNFSTIYELILKTNGCYLIINKPTRLSMRSKTSIDYILTNDSNLNITPGTIDYHISDRLFAFAVLQFNKFYNLDKNKKAVTTQKKFRKIKYFDTATYHDNLDYTLHSYMSHLPVITLKITCQNLRHLTM